jgi:hypothetical protein
MNSPNNTAIDIDTLMHNKTSKPVWIRRGNTIITMISGGAFLGVLLAQIPGATVGGTIAGIFGWFISKPKTAQS